MKRWTLERDGSYTREEDGQNLEVCKGAEGWWWLTDHANFDMHEHPTPHAAKCACTRAVKETEG